LKAELDARGFVVLRGLVGPEVCVAAASAIRRKTTGMLRMMGIPSGEHFQGLLKGDWIHSPPGWRGPAFGPICARGWQQGPGTGRIRAPLIEISIHSPGRLRDKEDHPQHHNHRNNPPQPHQIITQFRNTSIADPPAAHLHRKLYFTDLPGSRITRPHTHAQ
jgi:hypothetical protein